MCSERCKRRLAHARLGLREPGREVGSVREMAICGMTTAIVGARCSTTVFAVSFVLLLFRVGGLE
jgi:hypothetical protein